MVTMMTTRPDGTNDTAKLQFGAKAAILKKDFEAIIENSENLQILVAPDIEQPEGEGVTLEEFIDFVAAMYNSFSGGTCPLNAAKIKEAIGKIIDPGKFTIDLNMLFMYALKHGNAELKDQNVLDYAFKLSVHYEMLDPAIAAIFEFKSLYMAVWNTQRAKIVDKMKLKSISGMLEAYN